MATIRITEKRTVRKGWDGLKEYKELEECIEKKRARERSKGIVITHS